VLVNFKKSIKGINKLLAEGFRGFNTASKIGLILLILSFCVGLISRNSAYVTNAPPAAFPKCDNYGNWTCIPTIYLSIPLPYSFRLIINLTSSVVLCFLFILGVILVRNRNGR